MSKPFLSTPQPQMIVYQGKSGALELKNISSGTRILEKSVVAFYATTATNGKA